MDHLSASSIGTFLRCQRQWYYRYQMGLKMPPGVALVQGFAVHDAASTNYVHKMSTENDLDRDTVLDVARDSFMTGSEDCDWSQEEIERGPALDETVSVTGVWHEELAPLVMPTAVEVEFTLDYDQWEWPLLGYKDTCTDKTIIDLKTASKKKTVDDDGLCEELERNVQADVYLLHSFSQFDGRDFMWHVAVKTKTPATQVIMRKAFDPALTIDRIARHQEAIRTALETGVFSAADPGHWTCSPKSCGYWHICPFGGK